MSSPHRLLTRHQIAAMTGMGLSWVDQRLRDWQHADRRFRHVGQNTGKRWRQADIERKLHAELRKD